MKYFVIARHAKWLGTPEEFQTEAQALAEGVKAILGSIVPRILSSPAKRAAETAAIVAKRLESLPPLLNTLFLGSYSEIEMKKQIEAFLGDEAVIVVCHQENSRLIMSHMIQILGLQEIDTQSLEETGTAYVLDCRNGEITFVPKTTAA